MNLTRFARRAACIAAALAACATAQAQTRPPGLTTVPQGTRSVNQGQAATFGLPSPSGVRTPFPAGLTAGRGLASAADPNATPSTTTNLTTTVDPAAAAAATAANANATGIMGSGGVTAVVVDNGAVNASGYVAGGTTTMGAGPAVMVARSAGGPFTPLEVAASFLNADANNDGSLTRAEATRLAIMPLAFEDMDTNHDGVLSRSEYEATVRP